MPMMSDPAVVRTRTNVWPAGKAPSLGSTCRKPVAGSAADHAGSLSRPSMAMLSASRAARTVRGASCARAGVQQASVRTQITIIFLMRPPDDARTVGATQARRSYSQRRTEQAEKNDHGHGVGFRFLDS